jgi:hypothetical protein
VARIEILEEREERIEERRLEILERIKRLSPLSISPYLTLK